MALARFGMTGELRRPTQRLCERCGREEYWEPSADAWRITTVGEKKKIGSPYCIHEWDINGAFVPFER